VLLKPGGRFYLVTKQLDLVQPIVERAFRTPRCSKTAVTLFVATPKPT